MLFASGPFPELWKLFWQFPQFSIVFWGEDSLIFSLFHARSSEASLGIFLTVWSGASFSAAPASATCFIVSLSWIGVGSFTHPWPLYWPRECNTMIGQAWVPCPPPESERNRLPQHLAWEWTVVVFLKWIGVVFLESRCKQGAKNSQYSLHTPFGAVIPRVKYRITGQWPTAAMSTSFRETLPAHSGLLRS